MDELLENIRTFWKSAQMVYSAEDHTSATILYFKSLFVLLDLIILKEKKMTPKDHTERFRILEESFPELYKLLDKIFPIYRDTYSLKIEKEKCEEVRRYVISTAERYKIQLDNR